MIFEWDESKRQANITNHRIDFVDAIRIFQDDPLTIEDTRFDYGESRFWAIGLLNGLPIVVVHTYPYENTIRIVSARKATKHEQRVFFA